MGWPPFPTHSHRPSPWLRHPVRRATPLGRYASIPFFHIRIPEMARAINAFFQAMTAAAQRGGDRPVMDGRRMSLSQ